MGGQVCGQKGGRDGTWTEGWAGRYADRRVGGQVRGQKGGQSKAGTRTEGWAE